MSAGVVVLKVLLSLKSETGGCPRPQKHQLGGQRVKLPCYRSPGFNCHGCHSSGNWWDNSHVSCQMVECLSVGQSKEREADGAALPETVAEVTQARNLLHCPLPSTD